MPPISLEATQILQILDLLINTQYLPHIEHTLLSHKQGTWIPKLHSYRRSNTNQYSRVVCTEKIHHFALSPTIVWPVPLTVAKIFHTLRLNPITMPKIDYMCIVYINWICIADVWKPKYNLINSIGQKRNLVPFLFHGVAKPPHKNTVHLYTDI